MKTVLTYSMILILLLLTACSKDKATDGTPPSGNTDLVWPLAVGNSWTLEITSYDSSDSIVYNETQVQEITESIFRDERNMYVFDDLGNGYYEGGYNGADGLYVVEIEPDTVTSELWHKYPGQVGEYWDYDGRTEIISTSTQIDVPAGTFNCYEYKTTSEWGITTTYLSPGIGFIKSESTWPDFGGYGIIELLSYNVDPDSE